MILSVDDRLQFQYLLPVQGNFKTLELVEGILKKLHIETMNEDEREFIFSKEELLLMKQAIEVLDNQNKLPLQSLSVIRKIMEETI